MSKTVLLTGISGFIAKRIAHDLLTQGYHVKGSLRSMARADDVRAAVGPVGQGQLSFVKLDLTQDDGWSDAMTGVDVLMHTASPFPLAAPKNADDVIRPAVDGTLRALRAAQAAGVTRVILTASIASVAYSQKPQDYVFGPKDWTDVNWAGASPYIRSKTLAEKAARDFAAQHPDMHLTTIHPGLVCGAPMDQHFGSSLAVIQRLLSGKDPAVPDIPMPIIDIQDVSALHIAAMENDSTAGQRLMAVSDVLRFPQMARILADAYPDRKIATRTAPWLLLKLLSFTDATLRSILPTAGVRFTVDTSDSAPLLPQGFVPAPETILRAAGFLNGLKPGG